ncbi:unnamed protein product [Trifolium pratense]|uniref:Uncharacterized protein n=1 Tax=Trifolium pratense TaxID=57577 RepID=A0ACB0I949_TRIPR|nr:unnamed protein product [Trifolium pratense]
MFLFCLICVPHGEFKHYSMHESIKHLYPHPPNEVMPEANEFCRMKTLWKNQFDMTIDLKNHDVSLLPHLRGSR